MKRAISLTALLLAAVLFLMSFAACGKKTEEKKSLEGTYKMTEATGDADVYQESMDEASLVIDEDNVGIFTYKNSTATLTFDTDENTVAFEDADSIAYTFDGEELVIEDSTGRMVFVKE